MLPPDPTNRVLAQNVNSLLSDMPVRGPRPEVAARIGIGDKTLGFLKAGTGNPTLESITKVARFFKREPWQLLKPDGIHGTVDGGVNVQLLSKAVLVAQEGFQNARRVPSNEQLSAAATYVYALLLKGQHLDAAAAEVKALIERASSHAGAPELAP